MSTDTVDDTAWLAAVYEAVEGTGADPDALLDHLSPDGAQFVESLESLVDSDWEDPSFARTVEALATVFLADHPHLRVTEAEVQREESQVVEAKGTDANGGRVFRVQILRNGVSRNGNRYTESVMRAAAPLYDGAKAYDHHRTREELQTSTLAGLVGSYRNVEATGEGLFGDLHLLPSATHVAEALDRAVENQRRGLGPLVGISHDVICDFKPYQNAGGRRVREATAIRSVQSADVVADPSAGGVAIHAIESTTPFGDNTQESEVPVNKSDVLAALSTASSAELAAVGLGRTGTQITESTYSERVQESRVTEAGEHTKTSFVGRMMIREKAEDAGLDRRVVESAMPERFAEADLDSWIAGHKDALAIYERAGLEPRHGGAVVTRESRDKKVEALDKFFAGDFMGGYRSFKNAYLDISGHRPGFIGSEDLNHRILRESFGGGYDSAGDRVTESADTTTWAQLLGDSVTRRMVAEYNLPSLQTWRQIVSDVQPIDDFRLQRIGRLGGYGVLPDVPQGAPYQPLTTPGDEEATYTISKRGGTEDMTLETIANDDRRVISKIPTKLGRAAAQTLYRFVWDMTVGVGATCTYDSVALFDSSSHANYDASGATLTQTTVGVGRRKMRDQAAYGDTSEILGLQPKYLVVPNELEELADQICSSAVAIPSTPASASNTPNINSKQGLTPILVPYLTAAATWMLIADPNMTPTIEVGFYGGRQEPEIFTQSDNTVGSMFNNDTILWKIRHIYSGTVLDHRAFYKGLT